MECLGITDETGWDGMGWDGMGWDGMGWDEMGQVAICLIMSLLLSHCLRLLAERVARSFLLLLLSSPLPCPSGCILLVRLLTRAQKDCERCMKRLCRSLQRNKTVSKTGKRGGTIQVEEDVVVAAAMKSFVRSERMTTETKDLMMKQEKEMLKIFRSKLFEVCSVYCRGGRGTGENRRR
eukprot:767662-Hanusia_phi.AAC.8